MSVNGIPNAPASAVTDVVASDQRVKEFRAYQASTKELEAIWAKDRVEISSEARQAMLNQILAHKPMKSADIAAFEAKLEARAAQSKTVFELTTDQGKITIKDDSGLTTDSPLLALAIHNSLIETRETGLLPKPKDEVEATNQLIDLVKTMFSKSLLG